ncbi:hypothetical protein pb186bvf_015271 [Paramecium bursaria]
MGIWVQNVRASCNQQLLIKIISQNNTRYVNRVRLQGPLSTKHLNAYLLGFEIFSKILILREKHCFIGNLLEQSLNLQNDITLMKRKKLEEYNLLDHHCQQSQSLQDCSIPLAVKDALIHMKYAKGQF